MTDLVLSLFPGLGMLDWAFAKAGFCVVAGPDRIFGEDVRGFHPPAGRFDGVIGGSPCQAFSALANLVRAKGLEPRFGNLIPEFERVVVEASPLWFLHENVPAAPIPSPKGYSVQDFVICNSSIPGEDGLGQEQERVRRFTFGVREPREAPSLLRWIPRAALRLPAQLRTSAALSDARETPVKIGGSGKLKRTRVPTVQNGGPTPADRMSTKEALRIRRRAVSSDEGGQRDPAERRPGSSPRRPLAEILRLQGLPEDLLDDLPLTSKAARKLVANGVPMPMGRAVAKAVKEALEELNASSPPASSLLPPTPTTLKPSGTS